MISSLNKLYIFMQREIFNLIYIYIVEYLIITMVIFYSTNILIPAIIHVSPFVID